MYCEMKSSTCRSRKTRGRAGRRLAKVQGAGEGLGRGRGAGKEAWRVVSPFAFSLFLFLSQFQKQLLKMENKNKQTFLAPF